MKVAFVYTEMENLGIQYLSSSLKQNGHQTRLFLDPQLFMDTVIRRSFLGKVFDYSDRIICEIEEYEPHLIAFSVLSTNYEWACNLARKIKNHLAVPIVFGGIHPTSLPEEVINAGIANFVIAGEGEYALLELLESGFDKKSLSLIKNLCYIENGVFFHNELRQPVNDLDSLPFPDKDLFYNCLPYLQNSYTIMTGRGCPHACTYCCNSFLNRLYQGKYLRRRSVGNVISELCWAMTRYKIKNVFFDDSTFTYDKKWLEDFAKEYQKAVALPCFCWVYPTDVDEGLIGILKIMNCKAVEMGVESLDRQIRGNIFRRFYENADIEKAIKLFNKNRIFCVVDNIKGFSHDPEVEMAGIVRFYNENRPNKIYIFEHRFFPKTEISQIFSCHGKTSSGNLLPFTITTELTPKRVKQLEALLILVYLMPKRFIEFLLNFKAYRLLPPVSSYNVLEILPYFINLFKTRKYRFWYPIRGTRRRYPYYFFSHPFYFLRRILIRWV